MRRYKGLGLVVGIGRAPVRFDMYREPSWPVTVLAGGALTTWYWSEYSSVEWSELSALESSGLLPSSPPGRDSSGEAHGEEGLHSDTGQGAHDLPRGQKLKSSGKLSSSVRGRDLEEGDGEGARAARRERRGGRRHGYEDEA